MQGNKEHLQQVLSNLVVKYRKVQNKSISSISNEIGISKSIWSDLEKGIKDPQLSTLWKVAEGLNIPLSKLIAEIEYQLPNNFSFIEEVLNQCSI